MGLPGYCETTLLPVYDFWTYDGRMLHGRYNASLVYDLERRLRAHVQRAIYQRTLSWRGPSAEQGLWAFETRLPAIPTYRITDGSHIVLDWHDGTTINSQDTEDAIFFAEKELCLARKIAAMAADLGEDRKIVECGPDEALPSLTMLRRFGYSHKDYPSRVCTVLDSRVVEPLYIFACQICTWDPTYSLCDALEGILVAMTEAAPLPLVTRLLIDEHSLLEPLDKILVTTFEEIGLIAPEIVAY